MGDEQPANQNHRSVLSCFAGAADVLAEHCRHWETNPAPFAMGRGASAPRRHIPGELPPIRWGRVTTPGPSGSTWCLGESITALKSPLAAGLKHASEFRSAF